MAEKWVADSLGGMPSLAHANSLRAGSSNPELLYNVLDGAKENALAPKGYRDVSRGHSGKVETLNFRRVVLSPSPTNPFYDFSQLFGFGLGPKTNIGIELPDGVSSANPDVLDRLPVRMLTMDKESGEKVVNAEVLQVFSAGLDKAGVCVPGHDEIRGVLSGWRINPKLNRPFAVEEPGEPSGLKAI